MFNSPIMRGPHIYSGQNRESENYILGILQRSEWDVTDYENTQRLKGVRMNDISSPIHVGEETWRLWEQAGNHYETPQVQTRAIIPIDEEGLLRRVQEELQEAALSTGGTARISGRIPFQIDEQAFGLYYVDIASGQRRAFRDTKWTEHNEAIRQGFDKRSRYETRAVPPGYNISALEIRDGKLRDILSGQWLEEDMEEIAAQVAGVHKLAFEYPHDPAQQTSEGALAIMMSNPTLVAFDIHRQVASVGYLEEDPRFTFAGIRLVEPTYFTHPGEQYRRHGLSSHLRQVTQQLVRHSYNSQAYNGDPLIVFNESIRNTSFPLCIANGCRVAGTTDGSISGNLGEAYTAIGPANPEIGYMPMGLTYTVDPRIELELEGSY